MEACGIEETYVEANCKDSQRCTVIDVWIHGINDKPLTIAECGEYFVSVDYKYNRWCNPVCGNKTIENYKPELRKMLMNRKNNSPKLTEGCLKMLETIDAISIAHCKEKDRCNDQYCTDKIPPDHEECNSSVRNTPKTSDNTDAEEAERNTATPFMLDSLFLFQFLMASAKICSVFWSLEYNLRLF